jgi:hypothetical protein
MTTCPICGAEAEALDRTGDAEGFDCPRHRKFKVAGSVSAIEPTKNRQEWEAALKRATERAKPDEWPCITNYDF